MAIDTRQRTTSGSTQQTTDQAFEPDLTGLQLPELGEAEAILLDLAKVFSASAAQPAATPNQEAADEHAPNLAFRYSISFSRRNKV